ncbi:hypothetical protein ABTY98_42085 [Streptomyces sp. NPDC096040]|uniref:hypothetical protein n=1 Tax=Streptomyces sp. NPDC096040 TaxID=3155541 RepID=UPI00331798C5
MAFRGFDAVKLTGLANDLDTLAAQSGRLHTQLASVLTSAQQNLPPGQNASRDPDLQDLVGDVVPMPAIFGGRRRLPGSLGGELGDMQASMKRRIKQLEGAQELAGRKYPSGRTASSSTSSPPTRRRSTRRCVICRSCRARTSGPTATATTWRSFPVSWTG